MNKFGELEEEDFQTVCEVIEKMVEESPQLITARGQGHEGFRVQFHLTGLPVAGSFVDRDTETEQMEHSLLQSDPQGGQNSHVLPGLGGIGKTQLAIAYARKHQEVFRDQLSIIHEIEGFLFRIERWSEAYKMRVFHFRKTEKILGKEHPDTLTSMNNLAVVLSSQGKYEDAEEMHRQVLALAGMVLGKEHPDTLTSMNNLAEVLSSQGKYDEAERMHRQALALRETVLGKEHPDTLGSMNNLAEVLSSQGKYDEAERMHRQALALRETVLGKEHPDTLGSMNNLAEVLSSQGKYDEAERIHRQALALRETVLVKERSRERDSRILSKNH